MYLKKLIFIYFSICSLEAFAIKTYTVKPSSSDGNEVYLFLSRLGAFDTAKNRQPESFWIYDFKEKKLLLEHHNDRVYISKLYDLLTDTSLMVSTSEISRINWKTHSYEVLAKFTPDLAPENVYEPKNVPTKIIDKFWVDEDSLKIRVWAKDKMKTAYIYELDEKTKEWKELYKQPAKSLTKEGYPIYGEKINGLVNEDNTIGYVRRGSEGNNSHQLRSSLVKFFYEIKDEIIKTRAIFPNLILPLELNLKFELPHHSYMITKVEYENKYVLPAKFVPGKGNEIIFDQAPEGISLVGEVLCLTFGFPKPGTKLIDTQNGKILLDVDARGEFLTKKTIVPSTNSASYITDESRQRDLALGKVKVEFDCTEGLISQEQVSKRKRTRGCETTFVTFSDGKQVKFENANGGGGGDVFTSFNKIFDHFILMNQYYYEGSATALISMDSSHEIFFVSADPKIVTSPNQKRFLFSGEMDDSGYTAERIDLFQLGENNKLKHEIVILFEENERACKEKNCLIYPNRSNSFLRNWKFKSDDEISGEKCINPDFKKCTPISINYDKQSNQWTPYW